MSAVAILSHHRKPLSSMTDEELQAEHTFWNQELECRYRWDQSPELALQVIEDIFAEQVRRALVVVRSERLIDRPIVVDDPGVAPAAIASAARIEIRVMGAGKARAEYRPSRLMLIAATAALLACLAGVTAMAGQRLVKFDTYLEWATV